MEIIFAPIACPICKRHSAWPFRKAEAKAKLASGEAVQMRCGYDDAAWNASAWQREVMMKLIDEDDAISRFAPREKTESAWMMDLVTRTRVEQSRHVRDTVRVR